MDKTSYMQISNCMFWWAFVSRISQVSVKDFINWLCTCINPSIKCTTEFGSAFLLKAALRLLNKGLSPQHFLLLRWFQNYHFRCLNQCNTKILLIYKFVVTFSGYRSEFEQHVVPSRLRSFLWALVSNLGIWTSDCHDHDSWEACNPTVLQCCPHL